MLCWERSEGRAAWQGWPLPAPLGCGAGSDMAPGRKPSQAGYLGSGPCAYPHSLLSRMLSPELLLRMEVEAALPPRTPGCCLRSVGLC